MTLNSRLATAAAAMKRRMMIRKRERVFLPVLPSKSTSVPEEAMVDGGKGSLDGLDCIDLTVE